MHACRFGSYRETTREARRRQGAAIKRHTQLLHSLLVQLFYKIKEHGTSRSHHGLTASRQGLRRSTTGGLTWRARRSGGRRCCCGITPSTSRVRRRGDVEAAAMDRRCCAAQIGSTLVRRWPRKRSGVQRDRMKTRLKESLATTTEGSSTVGELDAHRRLVHGWVVRELGCMERLAAMGVLGACTWRFSAPWRCRGAMGKVLVVDDSGARGLRAMGRGKRSLLHGFELRKKGVVDFHGRGGIPLGKMRRGKGWRHGGRGEEGCCPWAEKREPNEGGRMLAAAAGAPAFE
jgi:hypothetical protein